MPARARLGIALGACATILASGPGVATATVSPLQVEVLTASGTASYFSARAPAGRRLRVGRLELINRSAHPLQVELAPVDAETAQGLGSAYQVPGLRTHGATTWTILSARRVRVPASGSTSVDVSASVPPRTAPGQYLSGISIEVIGQHGNTQVGSNLAVSSVVRFAIGLELTVPGALRPKLVWTDATLQQRPNGLNVVLSAANRGNAIIQQVTGTVLVTEGRRPVARSAIGPGTFVAGTTTQFLIPLVGVTPAAGTRFRVRAALRYAHSVAELDRTLQFGARLEKVRQQYGGPGPTPPAGGQSARGGTGWAPIAGGAAAVLLLAAGAFGLGLRRGRA